MGDYNICWFCILESFVLYGYEGVLMPDYRVLKEHDEKIRRTKYLIQHSSGFVKADAQKYLKRLLRERKEFLRYLEALKDAQR